MIQLHLTRANNYEGVYLRLPATPAEIGEAFAWLDEISRDTESTKIVDAVSPVQNIGGYIRTADVNDPETMKKLNDLAERISRMSRQERDTFCGALDAESIKGLDNVLRIAGSLSRYIFLHGITNDRELGSFLVESGYKDFPDSVRPYLDYAGIGAEYYAERGGAYTPTGYVLRRSSFHEQLPESPVCRMTLCAANGDCIILPLPATEKQLERAKKLLSVENFSQVQVTGIVFDDSCLAALIPQNGIRVEFANDLASTIQEIQENGELLKLFAVLSVERPKTMTDALDFALDLEDYELVTENAYEYGQSVLRRHGADDELLAVMDGYMDFERLGEDAMIEDGVLKTEYGSVRCLSEPFSEQDHFQQML